MLISVASVRLILTVHSYKLNSLFIMNCFSFYTKCWLLLQIFLNGAEDLDARYILQGLHYLSTPPSNPQNPSTTSQHLPPSLQDLKRFVPLVQSVCKRLNLCIATRGPVILILDKVGAWVVWIEVSF